MPPKLGILAGGGDLPRRLIELCRISPRDYFVVAFVDQADPDLVADAPHEWIALGSGGKTLAALKRENVVEIVMAGGIKRPKLSHLKLDAYGAKLMARIGYRMLGDNSLLSALANELENEGFRVKGVDDLVQGLLAPEGVLGAVAPGPSDVRDISVGIDAARQLGARDIGQGVIVRAGIVVESEAEDGTDAMIERLAGQSGSHAGSQSGGQGGVLVKMKKPDQDSRIDLPAIGAATVDNAARAGLDGIAVEAGATLVLGIEATVQKADAAGLFLIGVNASDRPE
jgi:DUF1009 family protein